MVWEFLSLTIVSGLEESNVMKLGLAVLVVETRVGNVRILIFRCGGAR